MTPIRAIWSGLRQSLGQRSWPGSRQAGAAQSPAPTPTTRAPAADPGGTSTGWLRVLDHDQLLHSVQADRAVREIWRQSRLSAAVWQRDCLPALNRYAEFVQLVPASEAHHHAHVGGLLSHTVEMVLAAMTWRNGHLLPAGEPIEVIDAQRDEWTYVVFFGALLHDIAKTMTDLRIQWRARDMAEPLRWMPLAGSLRQITQGRDQPEYLVEFMPKSARDYTAHSRLAMMLLPGIAPASALNFMAGQPRTFEALNQYLTGEDKETLLAQIIRRADRASTERSLLSGSKARFSTAAAVPLIDLLMEAIGSMLRAGTALPLNRSGAAGWVHDGSLWFVAKRLADSVRSWIKAHAPDESVPGDAKNDRLFDTWQEYGCIQVNPASGQAIWYVTVHGAGAEPNADASEPTSNELEQGAYQHSLTMLRFPLAKIYADPAQYPAPMRGRIEVHAKRKRDEPEDADDEAPGRMAPAAPGNDPEKPELVAGTEPSSPEARRGASDQTAQAPKPASDRQKAVMTLKEPAFNKPKAMPRSPPPAAASPPPATPPAAPTRDQEPAAIPADATSATKTPPTPAADEPWLDADDAASAVAQSHRKAERAAASSAAKRPPPSQAPPSSDARPPPPSTSQSTGVPARPGAIDSVLIAALKTAPMLARQAGQRPAAPKRLDDVEALPQVRPAQEHEATRPAANAGPVVLSPKLPALAKIGTTSAVPEPSAVAIEFMQWLQAGLVSRKLKYNETGAAVHFTAEGMALVSPIIFKDYARECEPQANANERGMQIQREVIKAGWHMMGPNKTNIIGYEVVGRGGTTRSRLSAVVLVEPDRWVVPVPPTNPVLKLV